MFTTNPVLTARVRAATLTVAVAAMLAGQSAAFACDTSLAALSGKLAAASAAKSAGAGTKQVNGSGVFNEGCQPPVGDPPGPGETGDYPPIDLTGSLDGCWYTYVTASQLNPSGTYKETGSETFIGCLTGL